MARYNTLDDGSSLFEMDGGRQVRTALDPERLAKLGAEFDPTLALDKRATDITTRLDDVRAKYDPAYATARDERKKKSDEAAARGEIDQKAGELKRQVDEQRAADTGGATALNTAVKPLAQGEQAPRLSLTDAPAPSFQVASPQELADAQGTSNVAATQKRNLVPIRPAEEKLTMHGQAAMAAPQQGGGDPRLNAIGDLLMQQAVRRTGPTKGGWVPTSRSVARDEVPPAEYLNKIDEAEIGEEAVAKSNAEAAAKRFNETIVTPQLDHLEQNISSLDAAYQRRKAYDAKLAESQKFAEDQEKSVAEMKTVNPRDDYFGNHGGIFGRLLAGIAAGAGQWASMARGGGGPNNAMNIINDAIKDHGQMLRDKFDNAKDSAKMARNAYGQMLAQYGDPETAMEALNLKGEAIADKMTSVQMGRHLNANERSGFDQWLEGRKVNRASRWANIAGKNAGRTVMNEAHVSPSAGGTSIDSSKLIAAGNMYDKAGTATKLDRAQLSNERAQRATAVHLPPEYARQIGQATAFTTDEGAAKEMREQLKIAAGFRRAVNDLKDATDNFSSRPITPEKRAKAKGAQAILTELGKNALGIQTITQYHMPLLHELSGAEATDLWTLGTTEQGREKVKQLEQGLNTMEAEHFKQMTRSPDKDDWIIPEVKTEERH